MKLFKKLRLPASGGVFLSKKHLMIIAFAMSVAFVALIGLVLFVPPAQRIDTNTYQVVYLANGQAYFGKLQNTNGRFLVMKTPYTMQDVKTPSQEVVDADTAKETEPQTSTTLIKVSGQVYGPDESIALKAEQVVFWQNLRDDSKVSQALREKE